MLCVCGGHTLWASGVRAAGWSRVGSMSHNRRQTRSPCERRLDHHPRCDRPAAHCAACGRTCGWDVDIAGNVRPAAAGSALWPAPNPMSDVLTGGGWQTLHWLLLLAALWLAIGVVGLRSEEHTSEIKSLML